ncbi:MAG TPA: hypothetical protein VMZ92_18540 [Planctomycetota bacterium]|nr:hypothetical protein [Planctomycetota bacterium]
MAIEVRCECGKVLKVPEQHAGKRGKCPGCGKVLIVPMPEPKAPTPTPIDEPEIHAPAQPKTPRAPEPAPPPAPEPEPAPPTSTPEPPTQELDLAHVFASLKEREAQIPYTDEDELGDAKEIALGLAAVPGLVADVAAGMLAKLKARLDAHAAAVGEDDPHVRILREMHTLAAGVIEGKE